MKCHPPQSFGWFLLSLLSGCNAAASLLSFTGFPLVPKNSFQGSGLDNACEQVLYQTVNCDSTVATLGEKVYHHGLNNTTLALDVCSPLCENSLKVLQRRIRGACAKTPDIAPGYPVLSLIDSLYTGWNETCIKDKNTGSYCNGECNAKTKNDLDDANTPLDIIDSWKVVEDINQMPRDQLCSNCYGSKLRLMQQSPYSAYDQIYQQRLDYVNKG
jgi:hypothetical protein